jgi:membrane associated rhomboid family serine protease
VTFAWWAGWDLKPLLTDERTLPWQPWRLITSALPHVDFLHLAFNLYWLWVFGTRVEGVFGHRATAGLMLAFAAGSSAAEYAAGHEGVGLSGVGYGLFGLLLVLSRKDPRFARAVDGQTVALFVGWFVLCFALTANGTWRVGNVAHAAGALLGVLFGFSLSSQRRSSVALVALSAGTVVLIFLVAPALRPLFNRAADLAGRGYLDLEQGRYESAAEQYRQAVELDPGHADWWSNLALARYQLDQPTEALSAIERAQNLAPRDGRVLEMLVLCKGKLAYQKQLAGHSEEAIRVYREALALNDRQAWCWYNLGTIYQELKRTESAREAFGRAVALEPDNGPYRAALESLPR